MEILPAEIQYELIKIWGMQKAIQDQMESKSIDWIEERLRLLLERIRQFISKYNPQSYTVSLGVPFGANVSFTWSIT